MGNRNGRHRERINSLERRLAQRTEQMRGEHQRIVRGLEDSIYELRKTAEYQQELLEKPVTERRSKIDFVNGLKLQIRQTDHLLILGPKGTGKSTFLWLLGVGPQPLQSYSDGTEGIMQLHGYLDTIGIRGWTTDELIKLLVLLLYDGIPKDFILFASNDRIEQAVTALGLLGIIHPLIVIMSNDFWKNYTRGRINPFKNLDEVYNLDAYEGIKQLNLGTPLTHIDDIHAVVRQRAESGVAPFSLLSATLQDTFTIGMEVDMESNIKELLFRFIYIYEKIYDGNRLRFMNHATLRDFK